MNEHVLLIGCTAAAVALLGFFATRLLLSRSDGKLRERLVGAAPTVGGRKPMGMAKVHSALQRFGQVAAKPFMPKTREQQSTLRKKLGYAGIYSASGVRLVTGAKVIFLCGGLMSGYLIGLAQDNLLLGLSLGGLFGHQLPQIWLKMRIKKNQKDLMHALPDGLDLLVVCVEAGLTVDAAMQRVGQELALVHPSLSRELGIAHMETRVGLPRSEALKNLGQRTGSAALQSLAAMLIQADRFGTSIAAALRIHAETLRSNRQSAAEELAAKASVKMSFPLVLFIFPATFIVLAGPTVIGLMNSALFQ